MSLAMKYNMKKRMAKGGDTSPDCYAKGGEVEDEKEDGDMIDRIMRRRMAKGGAVEPIADFEDNDFDVMDQKEVPDDADYTAANSGDELGNAELDENDEDLIRRIMRSRAKKDSLPRPA